VLCQDSENGTPPVHGAPRASYKPMVVRDGDSIALWSVARKIVRVLIEGNENSIEVVEDGKLG
jgi:hypothetical protein